MSDPIPSAATGPVVKTKHVFKAGDTVACASTGEEFKVLKVTKEGNYECKGRAGIMPKECAEKPLTAAQKAELAAAAESDD